MYVYRCEILRVVDGDTVDAEIDLGFSIVYRTRIRLLGINTPETKGATKAEGLRAKDTLAMWLASAKQIVVETALDKRGKFGRVLGTLYADEVNLNERLVDEGFAVPYFV